MQCNNYHPTPLAPSPGPNLQGLPSLRSTNTGPQFLTTSLQCSGPLRYIRLAPLYQQGSNSNSHSVCLISFGRDLNRIDVFFQPLFAIPGKLIQKFHEISVLRGVTQTDFRKTHPVFVLKFLFPGKLVNQFFLRTLSVFVILDEFSMNRPVSCLKIIKSTIGCVFHKSV